MKAFKILPREVIKVMYDIDSIVDRYSDDIFRAAYSYLNDVHEAQDVVSEVLMKFFSCCETLDIHTDEHLKAWLLRVAVNLSKNIIKSARWRKNVPQDDDYQAEFLWNESELDVKQALDKLPNEYRTVIYLYYYEGYKTTEIAQILELPKGTVVSRLDRARKKLGTLLADYGKESMA